MGTSKVKHIPLLFPYIFIQQWGRATISRNISYGRSPIDLLQKYNNKYPMLHSRFILIYFENRILLNPVLGGKASVAHFITGHEHTCSQLNC